MSARDRFVLTRRYVIELDAIKIRLMEPGDEWRPDPIKVPGPSDPTAAQATYNVDVLGDLLDELRNREQDLENFIGVSLMVIERVRRGLGDEYANLLDWRYIDGLTWEDCHVSKTTGKRKVGVAFDWIDSIGIDRLMREDYEL